MNCKRLILSFILGIIQATVLFTILITINMYSIDYENFKGTEEYKIVGVAYLEVEKNGDDVVQKVNPMPIAVTSVVLGSLSYLGLGFSQNKKSKGNHL